MAIANRTCVSYCNQPKAHFGLPWVCPWDNHGKYHMDEKRIQCFSNASQHVPINLQLFPSNSTCKFVILAHFGTIVVNVTWMKRGFNAGQMHNSIYPSIFNRLRVTARYWSEIATFSTPLHSTAPMGVLKLEYREKCGLQKTRIMGLPGSDDSLNRFDTIPACDGQTSSLYQ